MTKSLAATTRWGWRHLFPGENILTHNVIVAVGTMTAGALGVAFQALVSHSLHPTDFGSVFAVVTLVSFIGLPAGAFMLLMARQTSQDLASGQVAKSATLLARGNQTLLIAGLGLAASLAVASPFVARILNLQPQLLLAAAVGVPFTLALPLLMGEFQGEQRFLSLSALLVGQAGLKLLGAIALGYVLGPGGIVGGISLATVVIYLVALWLLRTRLALKPTEAWWRPAGAYLAVILPSTLALAVLLSADVLLVKAFFPSRAAGEYAAVAALGRAIFWGASGIAAVLFPKIVFRGAQGRSGVQLVSASLVLVALGGMFGFGLLWLGSTWLLTAFAGSAYASAAGYLPGYAVGMTLLGAVAVLIAAHQSRGRPGFLAVLLPLTVLEPALLAVFHQSLGLVVLVLDVSMALILAGLAGLYLIGERLNAYEATPIPPTVAPAANVVRVGINQ